MILSSSVYQSMKLPETSSAGKKWTVEEDDQLIELLNNGTSIEDIAKQHKRTVGGIKSRIKKNVVRVHIEDMCRMVVSSMDPSSVKEMSSIGKLNPEEIEKFLLQKRNDGSRRIPHSHERYT